MPKKTRKSKTLKASKPIRKVETLQKKWLPSN